MRKQSLIWPGLALSLSAVARERSKVSRWLQTLEADPKAFKRPTYLRAKWGNMLADLSTGMAVLRDAQKAAEGPAKPRKK